MPDAQTMWLALGILASCLAALQSLSVARRAALLVAADQRRIIGMNRRLINAEQMIEVFEQLVSGDDDDDDDDDDATDFDDDN